MSRRTGVFRERAIYALGVALGVAFIISSELLLGLLGFVVLLLSPWPRVTR